MGFNKSQIRLFKDLIDLWSILSKRRHIQIFALIVLILLSAACEILSIGSVVPFIISMSNINAIYQNEYYQLFQNSIDIHFQPSELTIFFSIAFIIFGLLSGAVRVAVFMIQTRLSYAIGADITLRIYRKTLHLSYADFLKMNSSNLINTATSKVNTLVGGIVFSIISVVSATFLLITISAIIIFINPIVSLPLIFVISAIYLALTKFFKLKLLKDGKVKVDSETKLLKILQESYGGMRDILIDQTQEVYARIFQKVDLKMRHALGNAQILANLPRFIIESVGIILLTIATYLMVDPNLGFISAFPILALMAMGAQKVLPILQQIFLGISSVRSSQAALEEVMDIALYGSLIKKEGPGDNLTFQHEIIFNNVSFFYDVPFSKAIEGISFRIKKGAWIGLIGSSGSGKSTLVDILLGLLKPESGSVLIDACPLTTSNIQSWQKKIAHVPQSIFLADLSVSENIAFGIDPEKIDMKRVVWAAKIAHISAVIENLPLGYRTLLGERGSRLSGGQRQRIGIARALYKKAELIVLDESTSALDVDTELQIIRNLEHELKNVTVIIVSHREKILRSCTSIIKMSTGRIVEIGTYDSLFHNTF
jgi:ATP-binding cassette subfamily B protein